MRQAGVRQAVFPRDFTEEGLFAAQGIEAVPVLSLCRRMAPRAALELLRARGVPPGESMVVLAGERLSPDLCRAAALLSRSTRHLALWLPRGGETLCRTLRWELGLSPLLNPPQEQLRQARLWLLYDPMPPLWQPQAAVLPLYPGADFPFSWLPPEDIPLQVRENCSENQLLAALLEGGGLREEEIGLRAREKSA